MSDNAAAKAEATKVDDPNGSDADGSDTSSPDVPTPTSFTCIVNVTDGVENTIEAFFLEIQTTDIDDEKLSDLRALIVKTTRCVEILQLPFCLESGAVVQDSVSVDYYLSTCLNTDATDGRIEVYFKNEKPFSEKGWNDLVHSAYSSPLTGTNARHISELEEKQWNVVVETNQLCYASSAITQKLKKKVGEEEVEETLVVGVQKSRHPAFRLATRKILSDTLASSIVKNVEASIDKLPLLRLDLRIPRHINDDPSYVSMRYSTSAAEKSLAQHGFTQTDISASGGGGAFGFSVDVSASLSLSKETSNETQTATSKSDVTISYNFPRVAVFLDESGLELTTQCEADLREIRDAATYYKFLKKYGEFFSTNVQLGGELFATETSEANSDASREKTANAMKAAAAVALSGWGYSASISASHQTQSGKAAAAVTQSSSKALIWQANGGNTLLCNDPAAWAPSVAYYGNWRVIKQGNVVRIMDLISKMKGFEYVRAKLAVWKRTGPIVDPPVAQKFTLNAQSTAQARYLVGKEQNYANGRIQIGPKPETKTLRYLVWELALAKGGSVVAKVEYGVDYYLLHCESRLYPGLYDLKRDPRTRMYQVQMYAGSIRREKVGSAANLSPVHMVEGIRSRDYTVRFYNEGDEKKTGSVQNGDTITVELRQASGAIGHLAEQSFGAGNSYLVATKRTEGYTPMKLTYTEVGESDLQAANEVNEKDGEDDDDDDDADSE